MADEVRTRLRVVLRSGLYLTLLAEGIGDHWCLADINPEAIDCRLLSPGGMLFILEISVAETEVHTPDFAEPYDIRERPPLDDFREMIAAGGLTFVGVEPLFEVPGGFHAEMLTIRNDD